jgi:chemotaxis protein MotC
MDPERETVIYLRIARRAAIDGLTELSTFASARAEKGRDGNGNADDPRAQLYSSLSTVTSSTIDDVRAKLKKIDRGKLSESDRALLDAAEAVAGEVVARPVVSAVEKPDTDAGKPAADIAAAEKQEDADLPPVEGAMSERPAVEASASATQPADAQPSTSPKAPAPATAASSAQEPVATGAPAVAAASAGAAAAQPATTPESSAGLDPQDATDAAMMQTRRQLSKIDQLLGAAPK